MPPAMDLPAPARIPDSRVFRTQAPTPSHEKGRLRPPSRFHPRIRSSILLGLVSAVINNGCMVFSATGPIFEPSYIDSGDRAVFYVYRPTETYGRLVGPTIALDDHEIGLWRDGGYFDLVVKPGRHILETKYNRSWWMGEGDRLELNVKPGERYFIRVQALPGYSSALFRLSVVMEDNALIEIRDTRRLDVEQSAVSGIGKQNTGGN